VRIILHVDDGDTHRQQASVRDQRGCGVSHPFRARPDLNGDLVVEISNIRFWRCLEDRKRDRLMSCATHGEHSPEGCLVDGNAGDVQQALVINLAGWDIDDTDVRGNGHQRTPSNTGVKDT
jgi:hypothetical protein